MHALNFTFVRTCLRRFLWRSAGAGSGGAATATGAGASSSSSTQPITRLWTISTTTGASSASSDARFQNVDEPHFFAVADDAFIDQINVRFQVALFHRFARLATTTFQGRDVHVLFGFCGHRELYVPEIVCEIQKSHAVGIDVALGANRPNQTHFCLFVGIQAAKNQFLLRGKFVAGNDACSMPAEQHRLGLFREDLAFGIASNQKDIDLFGNSAAAAHTVGGHSISLSEREL